MSVEVRTTGELKAAVGSGVTEIIVTDKQLAGRLKAVYAIRRLGPVAVGGVIAVVPFIVATGGVGAGLVAGFSPGLTWTGAAIAGLVVAVGGTIAINLFTDWDYVELPMGIKMERRCAKSS